MPILRSLCLFCRVIPWSDLFRPSSHVRMEFSGEQSKYGGARSYGRLKPVMLGLIAGDMLAQLAITGTCAVYSLSAGNPPRAYWVLPG